jgi:signal transduction histidine kinase
VSERTQQLETALRDLESFNSMVSHDLRAPLAVIQMAVDVIERERDLPAKIPSTIARVRRAVHNMSSLVTDLLALAQVGHHALEPTEVDLSAVSAEVVQELQAASPDRSVEVRIEPGLRASVDHTIFRSALTNLIGNAWKYTAQTSTPRIEVGAVHRSDGRALFVKDNGIGFDMKDMDKLFRPFTRLSNAAGFNGTGIGLATVERVVQRHGGTLRAEGSLGNGATFFAVLPSQVWR